LVRAGVPDSIAMKMTGHETRAVFDRYEIVSEADLGDAARKLDLLTGTIAGTIAQNDDPQPLVEQVANGTDGKDLAGAGGGNRTHTRR
jgi:hypothetical protein